MLLLAVFILASCHQNTWLIIMDCIYIGYLNRVREVFGLKWTLFFFFFHISSFTFYMHFCIWPLDVISFKNITQSLIWIWWNCEYMMTVLKAHNIEWLLSWTTSFVCVPCSLLSASENPLWVNWRLFVALLPHTRTDCIYSSLWMTCSKLSLTGKPQSASSPLWQREPVN